LWNLRTFQVRISKRTSLTHAVLEQIEATPGTGAEMTVMSHSPSGTFNSGSFIQAQLEEVHRLKVQADHLHVECMEMKMVLVDASQLRARGLEAFYGRGLKEHKMNLADVHRIRADVLAVCEPSCSLPSANKDEQSSMLAVLAIACADISIKWVWWARVCAPSLRSMPNVLGNLDRPNEATPGDEAERQRMRHNALWLFLTCRVLVLSREGDEARAPPQALAELWLATKTATPFGIRQCRPGHERCVSILVAPATLTPAEAQPGAQHDVESTTGGEAAPLALEAAAAGSNDEQGAARAATVPTSGFSLRVAIGGSPTPKANRTDASPIVARTSTAQVALESGSKLSPDRRRMHEQLQAWAARSLLEAYLALRPQAGYALNENDDFERTGVLSQLLLIDQHVREAGATTASAEKPPPPVWPARSAARLHASAAGEPADEAARLDQGIEEVQGLPLAWHVAPDFGSPAPSPTAIRRSTATHLRSALKGEKDGDAFGGGRGLIRKRRSLSQGSQPVQLAEEQLQDMLKRSLEKLQSRLPEVLTKDDWAQKQLAMAMVRLTTTGEDSHVSPMMKKLTRAAAKVMGMNRAARREDITSKKVEMLQGMHNSRAKGATFRDVRESLNEPAQALIRASVERRQLLRQMQVLQEHHALLADERRMAEAITMHRRVRQLQAVNEAAIQRGDDTFADVTLEIEAIFKIASAPAAVAAQLAAEHGGTVDGALGAVGEALRAKEATLRELGRAYQEAQVATIEAARQWNDATKDYAKSKKEEEEVMVEELELVCNAQVTSWQRQLCEAEHTQLEYLFARLESSGENAAPHQVHESSPSRLVAWNRAAAEQKAKNAEMLNGLSTAHAEVATAAAAFAEAAESAKAAAQTVGQLKESFERISSFLSVRPKGNAAQWDKWLIILLDAADAVRSAQEEYAPHVPKPSVTPDSSLAATPTARGSKSGAGKRGAPVGIVSAREKRMAAEKAALVKAHADMAALEKAAAERAASERAQRAEKAGRAAAERAKTGDSGSDDEVLHRAEKRYRQQLDHAVDEMARLVRECRGVRQAWEVEMLALAREEEALLDRFGVAPKPRAKSREEEPALGIDFGIAPSSAPIFQWSELERVQVDEEAEELAPPAFSPAAEELPLPPVPAPTPAPPSRVPTPPPAPVLPPRKPRPKLPKYAPFSPQARAKDGFMESTGSSSARLGVRDADSTWLESSLRVPTPLAGRHWLLRDLDTGSVPPHRRPKLRNEWSLHSPPRGPVVVNAFGGAVSTAFSSYVGQWQPISPRPLPPRPISTAPGGTRAGLGPQPLPAGCWGSLAMRDPLLAPPLESPRPLLAPLLAAERRPVDPEIQRSWW
jgi:hypothetical protein